MEPPILDPDPTMNDPEHPLNALRPLAPALSRDRMLFEAGRATGRAQGRNRWFAATATLSTLIVALGGLLAREHTHRQSLERTLASRVTEHAPTVVVVASIPPEASPYSYLAMSRRAQSGHLDDWTRFPVSSPTRGDAKRRARPLSVRDLGEALDL
jgi:hypothetical protein